MGDMVDDIANAGADGDGAWASDDIPVPDAPTGTSAPTRPVDPTAVSSSATTIGAPVFGAFTTASPPSTTPPTTPFWTRGKQAAVGAVAAGVLVVAAVSLTGGTDDATDSASSGTEVVVPDDSVDPETTDPENSDPESTDVPARPSTTAPEPFTQERISLPPVLARMSVPTEVLLLSDDGVLHTVSLPSGQVRSVPLGSPDANGGFGGQDIAVAPDAAAVPLGDGLAIVPRTSPVATIVDGSELPAEGFGVFGWSVGRDGATRFSLVSYSGSGSPRTFQVGLDGTVEPADQTDDPTSLFATLLAPDGSSYVNDAGGVYAVESDGSARRIDDGQLRGASATNLLLRTCTADLVCGDVVVDKQTAERRDVATGVIPDELSYYGVLDLAPDGSAVSGIIDEDGTQERVVVDLSTGEQVVMPTSSWNNATRWAADSSGIFELSQDRSGVVFLERASGEEVAFAEDLGQIVALGIRMPAAELGPESTVVSQSIFFDGVEPAASGIEVVALTRSGNVVVVDIDARNAEVWAPSSFGVRKPSLFPFGEQVAVVSNDDDPDMSPGYVDEPGARRALPMGLFGPGPILPGPIGGTAWSPSGSQSAGVTQELIDLDRGALAEPTRIIDVPGSVLLGGDGRGGLVVLKGGDVYIATADGDATGLRRLTTGDLLALGADTAFVRERDEAATCSVIRVDRVTGARTMLPEMLGLGGASGIDPSDPPFGLMGTAVAPGGGLAVVRIGVDDGDGWMLVDIVNGPFAIVDGVAGDVPFVWSDDGTSAVTLIGADLWVVALDADGVSVVAGLGSMRSLAAAPVAPG